jgi:hypothetical protein
MLLETITYQKLIVFKKRVEKHYLKLLPCLGRTSKSVWSAENMKKKSAVWSKIVIRTYWCYRKVLPTTGCAHERKDSENSLLCNTEAQIWTPV